MQYKVDFHTHSAASPDGALTEAQYRRILQQRRLDCIAVTDHNTIEMAQRLRAQLGNQIIIGEEITTMQGEIIGLFLQETVPPFLAIEEAIRRIRNQGGLVYIPHPFETVRKGLSLEILDGIAGSVDIIEAYNGRAVFQNRTAQALAWAQKNQLPVAAGSDAHGVLGWGRTYTLLSAMPTRQNLTALLKQANHARAFPGLSGMVYPKLNRLRKWKWGV